MAGIFKPIYLPDWAWLSPSAHSALRDRDVAGVLRLAQQYGGASQHRLAAAVGLTQGRLSEILKGSRTVTALEVYERIADGLNMPDHARQAIGLAPQRHALDNPAGWGEIVQVFPDQAAATQHIQAAAATAARIDVLAVRGLGLVGLKGSLLRPALTRTPPVAEISILLARPDAPATAQRAQQIGESPGAFADGIRLCVNALTELAHPRLALYLYDTPPVWRIIALDHTLFVSTFTTSRDGHHTPTYKIVETTSGSLYHGFVRSFSQLRDHATRVI